MNYAIYPYHDERKIYIDNISKYRQDINILVAVHPRSITINSNLSSCIEISDNFMEAVNKVDAVLFLEGAVYQDILSKVEYAVCRVHKVICCHILLESDLEKVKLLCQKYGTEFEYRNFYTDIADLLKKRGDPYAVQECVVMGVSALTQGINTDEAVIGLSLALKNRGYRVVSIVSSHDLTAYGFYYLPYNELSNSVSDLDQFVLQLNRFFNWIQFKERPDIILVQFCDENMIQLSTSLAHSFGIKSFILSQAIAIDYSILFVPCDVLDDSGIRKMSECFSQRFGFHIDAVCIESRIIDQPESKIMSKMVYRKVQSRDEITIKKIKDEAILYINKHQEDRYSLVADNLIYKLSYQ